MSATTDLIYRLLVQSVSDHAIYMISLDGVVLNWNPGAARLKGYAAEEIIGRNFSVFYSPEDQAADLPRRNLEIALRDGRTIGEGWRHRRDGTSFWASITIDPVHDATGEIIGFAKITRDLTAQHEMLVRLQHQANHDSLTGLLNRAGLCSRIEASLAAGRPVAIHCLDLDGFKAVNDSMGHAAGDLVLQEIARRLRRAVGGAGYAGRLGGDELVAVQEAVSDPGEIRQMAERLLRSIREPVKLSGTIIEVGVSVGIARTPADGTEIELLLRRADETLYRAKRKGGGRIALHGED